MFRDVSVLIRFAGIANQWKPPEVATVDLAPSARITGDLPGRQPSDTSSSRRLPKHDHCIQVASTITQM